MPQIKLKDVSKSFGNVEVCKQINLTVANGEFVTLLGSSGCGKTTTLNMIAGLDEVTSGDILMDGRRVNDLEPIDRDVAMVFQDYALYPHMTVSENLGFTLRLKGVPTLELNARVKAAVESLGLAHLIERYPAQLSGGQQQRVAIGRAIVRSPKVFLFDEPFSNLDAALRSKMRGEIKVLHNQLGVTSIFVTHDQEEALSISDRVAIMHEGKIQHFGTPEEIYTAPANTYVAKFIGNPQVEILSAEVGEENGSPYLQIGSAKLDLLSTQVVVLRKHRGQIDVAIRPEHVSLGADGISARVRIAQPSGPSTVVTVDWPGGTALARLNGIVRLQPGTAVHANVDTPHLMFFDHITGKRIT